MVWLFVFLLGLTLYFIVQRSVVRVTRTPWWQLWLALMIPAFTIVGWALARQSVEAMPMPLLIGSFGVSVILYIFLITRNPRLPAESEDAAAAISGAREAPLDPSAPTPLSKDEQEQLQSCFPWSVYYLKNVDLRPQAVICRGQLRGEAEVAYQTIRANIQAAFGDRFLVLFQTSAAEQPFFALVNNPYAKTQRSLYRPGLALGLLVLTLATTTLAGLGLSDPTLDPETLSSNPRILANGLPYAIALLGILGIRELSYYFTARSYNIEITLPYFIPIPFAFGTVGAYLYKRSPIPHRKALFDIGLAGPLTGLIIALPIFIWGLAHSELAALPDKPGILSADAFNPRFSIAFAVLCRIVFGQNLTSTLGVDFHPIAVAGGFGLIFTAIKLIPFGQFDGGRIIHAMYGQRMGLIVSQISRILILLLSFVQPILLYLGIFLMVVPAADEPALNDVSELDNARDVLGLLALGLMLLLVLPVPAALEPFLFATNPTP
ncbi:site-2 protease family protein [Altericista sp. CCNU0014]|uniref:site-2 protease family protein n=1 Tax=Altericista sp. CCNU0014 TaxID=3082949 RepID=UPI00384EEAFB